MGLRGMETLKYGREDSLRSSFSRASSTGRGRKIGGLARRIIARQSTRHMAEIKKNLSQAASLYDNESPPRELQIEMAQTSQVGAQQIQVVVKSAEKEVREMAN
mmetsp:Transcript_37115/g.56948  ORF Transcript_37115/g.56948 Transcript_37115/m.56948 type:complete len:104 (+) Transcript_37115:1933-2244(+)